MTKSEYRALQVLDLLRIHPGITILEIAGILNLHRDTIAVYFDHLQNMDYIIRDSERVVTITPAGMAAEIPIEPPQSKRLTFHRNLPVERKHPKRGQCQEWTPKGGTLTDRINAIVERDRQARLAPEGYTR